MLDDFVKVYNALAESKVEDPFSDTIRLIDILSKRRLSKIGLTLPNKKNIDISELVRERKRGVPLEYILGMAPFMGKFLYCSPDTLIPREETELLANVTLDFIKKKQKETKELMIIDMGTGCGNIAVSLALNSEGTKILASDLKPETIAIARKNVEQFNLQNRITLFSGDLFSPLKDPSFKNNIDIVVCNPPYIPTGSLEKMDTEVIGHEPREAFDAGPFGINIYRRLINESLLFLKSGGILIFEIGLGQEKLVAKLFSKKEEYSLMEHFTDGEKVRVISAVRQ